MAQTNINIRIDKNLKKQFDELCNELGMSMSTAINIFAKAMVRKQAIPFEVSLNKYNEETIKAMEDVKNNRNLVGPFNRVEDVMNSLLEDD